MKAETFIAKVFWYPGKVPYVVELNNLPDIIELKTAPVSVPTKEFERLFKVMDTAGLVCFKDKNGVYHIRKNI